MSKYPTKILTDGRALQVIPLTFGRSRIIISRATEIGMTYEDGW